VTELAIRPCARSELRALEWDGEFHADREVFARVYALAERGAMAMLVATWAHDHVGQIWIDLARDRGGAVLWALRVKPPWRRRGIGARLVAAGEQIARRADRSWAELEVEPQNVRAHALYERLGYRWVRRQPAIDALTGAPLAFELEILRRPLQAQGPAAGERDRQGARREPRTITDSRSITESFDRSLIRGRGTYSRSCPGGTG